MRFASFVGLVSAGVVLFAAPAGALPAQPTGSTVASVRIGHHAEFDRLVLTFRGPLPKYRVSYVKALHADASGKLIPVKGKATVRIVLHPMSTTAHQPQGTWTTGYPEIRQVKGAGNFEGYVSYGVGLADRERLHVFTLASPNRLVIDAPLR